MIKFFRHIRKSLIQKNQIGKYFKYAIGEILLVVIGILIALQINNWNENSKDKKQEQVLLKQLQTDIISNNNEVMELKMRLHINKSGIDSLISKLDNKKNDKSIPVYLGNTMRKIDFNSARSGYNIMQNSQTPLISDEEILRSVLNLYEDELANILGRQEEMNSSIDYIQKQFINKLFVQAPNNLNIQFKELDVVATEVFKPLDFNALSRNTEFRNTLFQLGKLIEKRLAYLNITEVKLKRTINLLQDKIKH